jgi:anaerobic selenocysteine-containing dehydrogenase
LCEAICGLEFRFEGGALTVIRGDGEDPFSRGHICPKGNAILDLESDPDRLRKPLRRHNGEFEEIAWDEAFAFAGERLASIQREHGAAAVASYLGNPNVHHFGHLIYVQALLRLLASPNVYTASSVDQWPHQLIAYLMFGHQFLLPIVDLDRCHTLLMLGANPVASNGSLMTAPGVARRLEALAERGCLIVVDPRRTETAEIASLHLPIRPGTDAWFLLALLGELRRLGPARLERYGDRLAGFDTALAAVAALDPSDIETRTGIGRATIRSCADALYHAPTAAAYGRMGVSTQRYGSLCQWLLQLVNLYTGNLDREGGCLPNDPVMPITGPGTARGHYGRWKSRVRGLPEFAGELPVAALAEEIATPGPGQVRALMTCAGNPVLSTPNGRALEAVLPKLDFMLSIDVYVNETTRHADLILPPTSPLSQYHYDAIFNAFAVRRVARLNTPLVPQPPEERADWQIVNAVAAHYAVASGKAWQPLPEPRLMIAAGLARGGEIDIDTLEATLHGVDLGPLRPTLLQRLQTEDGRIACAPPLLLAELERLRADPLPAADQLLLIGRRDVRSNNSWMHNAPRLIKGKPRHHLLMHPTDLAARGLADGDRVELSSAAGRINTMVRASEAMTPGAVCLPHGFGHARAGVRLANAAKLEGASYNDLTDPSALDAPSGNAALNALPVNVAPLSATG